jgi:hypothetical protein
MNGRKWRNEERKWRWRRGKVRRGENWGWKIGRNRRWWKWIRS